MGGEAPYEAMSEASFPTPPPEAPMTRLKQLFRRIDAYTLEAFNPPRHRRPR